MAMFPSHQQVARVGKTLLPAVALLTLAAAPVAAAGWSQPVCWEWSTNKTERMPWVEGNTVYLIYDTYDIYFSTYDEALGSWSEPKPVPGPINTSAANEINPVVVKDGKVLYFGRYSALTDYDFWRSEWDAAKGEWGQPVKVSAWNTDAQEWDLWVNEDDTVAYLTTKGAYGDQKSLGGRDVWKSVRGTDGQWSTPVNLGASINSAGDEWSIFVGPDGKIYIDGNREGTLGKMDIFVAADEKSTPVDMGAPFNSPQDEREISFNDHWLFITSTRDGGKGGYDQWVCQWQN